MNAYCRQQIRLRSERARARVSIRWQRVRAAQRALEAAVARDPLRQPFRVTKRVIVIVGDVATEVCRLECDSQRSWRRKLAGVGLNER